MHRRLGSPRRSARSPGCSGAGGCGRASSAERYAMELVTGASGYIGGRLVERLLAQGRPVRALARNPARLDSAAFEVAQGDVVTGAGLAEALDGCTTAYYLIHSMERPLA